MLKGRLPRHPRYGSIGRSSIARPRGAIATGPIWKKLAATDEKDLSTSQSKTRTDPRFSSADGDAGRTQRAQAAPGEGQNTARDHDSAQATRLGRPASGFGFGAQARLHRRDEFLRVQRVGVRYQTVHFVVYAMSSGESKPARLGTTVSRRIGGAVVRNRVKRRVRECFRNYLRTLIPDGTDLVVIARAGAGELASPAIMRELTAATLNLRDRFKKASG
jgi:ribonuclease P protein component